MCLKFLVAALPLVIVTGAAAATNLLDRRIGTEGSAFESLLAAPGIHVHGRDEMTSDKLPAGLGWRSEASAIFASCPTKSGSGIRDEATSSVGATGGLRCQHGNSASNTLVLMMDAGVPEEDGFEDERMTALAGRSILYQDKHAIPPSPRIAQAEPDPTVSVDDDEDLSEAGCGYVDYYVSENFSVGLEYLVDYLCDDIVAIAPSATYIETRWPTGPQTLGHRPDMI
ncbi:hypothetical protein [Antarcticirhabdus aurantiaca]|uniref:Uncharacterized protein n=1 Tax=Antarcticirhabdus aurantiaca TaxID=2606717 RepID=A0ACD4NNV0_9HYPH|nr:hypothetical protein [Antarcticirhabdus aurantiaca]WAJ28399.1 hypothetical protein OXU80_26915 [Jeongeuplla avenae]